MTEPKFESNSVRPKSSTISASYELLDIRKIYISVTSKEKMKNYTYLSSHIY